MNSRSNTRGDNTPSNFKSESLGELEARVMDIIWDLDPPITASQVFKLVYPDLGLSYTTVKSTMTNLTRKGYLERQRADGKKTSPYIYAPTFNRAQVAIRIMNSVAEQLFKGKTLDDVLGDMTGNVIMRHDVYKLLKSAEVVI